MAKNILASSQLTACAILSFPGKVEVDYLRAVVNLLLTEMLSGLLSVVYFILCLNIQILGELLTVVTLLFHS